jgi:twitching motility protein PilI
MAARGFIELLRLADHGRQMQQGGKKLEGGRWSGIAFSVAGFDFVAPLGEVAEVIPVPHSTAVPQTKKWLYGLANVRGRLLPLTDLSLFLNLNPIESARQNKVIIVDQSTVYNGLIVDQVLGIQHFNKQSYFGHNTQLPKSIAHYTQGYFDQQGRQWHVFLFSQLMQDHDFLNASI